MRDLARVIERGCGRLNEGLIAVTIVLALVIGSTAAYRTAAAWRVPEGYSIAATT
jgi:hypothetical protein